MQTAEVTPQPQFAGPEEDQQVAAEIFQALCAMGRFFPKTAPIRSPLAALAGYFASRHPERPADDWAPELDRILSLNPAVFLRDENEAGVTFATTTGGRAPAVEITPDIAHTLARRFAEPVPLPERPEPVELRPRREAVEFGVEPTPAEVEEIAPVAEPVEAEARPEPELEELVEAEAAAPPRAVADIAAMDPAALGDLITAELRQDLSVANFGDEWMVEDKVPRLSRGDLRRIRDYLLERKEPLTDDTLLQDILGVRPSDEVFDLHRFALNFRLSREHREFEFVGTPGQRLWSTSGLPPIGTTKRKASELGQDYRFLLEYPPAEPGRRETVVEHVLTFYEYTYGVLPYDEVFQTLFPPAMQPDQRAAMLAFESPQTYETFFAELRFPTANRGGYVAGFERFFLENLVPGALITIEQNGSDGRYLLEYLPISGQDRKILQLDEKKGRYVFRPTTFYCATQENMVISENRFPRLANTAPLEERIRRRPDEVLAAMFERVGEAEGGAGERRYMVMLDDLLAVVNVERPMNAELIRDIVRSPAYPQFSVDPDIEDVFYYQPAAQ